MSFFDDVDEPPQKQPRSRPRTPSRPRAGRPPGGGGRRPPTDRQAVRTRQIVAAVVLVVVVILIAVGVHSCQVNAANSALRDYANSVNSVMTSSQNNSSDLFSQLAKANGSASAPSVQSAVNTTLASAQKVLQQAEGLNAPDSVKGAQQNLVMTLRMRYDAIEDIAKQIQPALGTVTAAASTAINEIAADMARLYASDVMYKKYVSPSLVRALHGASIGVGGTNGATINPDQFLPDVTWVLPTTVAQNLHVNTPTINPVHIAPGLHGHALNSVSYNGATLSPNGNNSIAAKPPPSFTLNFTNGGDNNEFNVKCRVTVAGTGITGEATVPETFAHQAATCHVTLDASPPVAIDTVKATIDKVPGETNMSNNSLSFPVTFH